MLNRLPEILNKDLKELKVVNESIIPKLIIYEKNDKLFLSWLIEIYSSQIDRWEIIIDDKSGDLIDKLIQPVHLLDMMKKTLIIIAMKLRLKSFPQPQEQV